MTSEEIYEQGVIEIQNTYGFDFVSIGLTSAPGAPLKWVYSAGATGERHKRIVLAPGHGIGGIVIKSGKPMLAPNIDEDIDPREYSSYPIVFAEDLRSFCAMPLTKNDRVVGALLCAFRSCDPSHQETYHQLINNLQGRLFDFGLITEGFLNISNKFKAEESPITSTLSKPESDISRIIAAQEEERRRISRELHDGIVQELVAISFTLNKLDVVKDESYRKAVIREVRTGINQVLDELHNISVELRPSTLDHLGLLAALKSRAAVFEKTYGPEIIIEGSLSNKRFAQALETQMYRICQEAILNACKYSGSNQIVVDFEEGNEQLTITISDQGEGFDTKKPAVRGSGCGLLGMYERASLIGADLKIKSSVRGTVVALTLPLSVLKDRSPE